MRKLSSFLPGPLFLLVILSVAFWEIDTYLGFTVHDVHAVLISFSPASTVPVVMKNGLVGSVDHPAEMVLELDNGKRMEYGSVGVYMPTGMAEGQECKVTVRMTRWTGKVTEIWAVKECQMSRKP